MCIWWLSADAGLMTMVVLMIIQEWDRCMYLAIARHLTQCGRACGPARINSRRSWLTRVSRGEKESTELKEVARYVVEDLNEDIFKELMDYMPECR